MYYACWKPIDNCKDFASSALAMQQKSRSPLLKRLAASKGEGLTSTRLVKRGATSTRPKSVACELARRLSHDVVWRICVSLAGEL